MKVVPYEPKYRQTFIDMNFEWIEKLFCIEAEDLKFMENLDTMLEQGGQIYFTLDDDDTVLACCMLAPMEDGGWEIAKFAARGLGSGKGAGSACLKACLDYAQEKGISRIDIVSNTKCGSALHLYRKFGFREVPVDKEKFPFERGDIAFVLEL